MYYDVSDLFYIGLTSLTYFATARIVQRTAQIASKRNGVKNAVLTGRFESSDNACGSAI